MARYHVEVEYHANGFHGSLACNFLSKMFEFDLNNCLNCCVGDNINPVFYSLTKHIESFIHGKVVVRALVTRVLLSHVFIKDHPNIHFIN